MKKSYFPNIHQKYIFLQISLMVGLIEGSYILIPASVFNLLQYGVCVEAYEENLTMGWLCTCR